MAFTKGARVKVIGGRKSMGVTGTIFWIGDNKYGEGQRFGIRGDDGETHWVPEEHCEGTSETMEVPEAPELSKGDEVTWMDGEMLLSGHVFWLGPNKYGSGTRAGVKDPQGETHWFDTRRLQRAEGASSQVAPAPASAPPDAGGSRFDQPAAFGAPAWDDGPPMDDAWAESVGVPEGSEAEGVSDDDIPF